VSAQPDEQRAAAVRTLIDHDLRHSAGELSAILNAVSDGITAQDPTGALVYANDAAARLVGFDTAEELLAAPIPEVLGRFDLLDELRRPLPLDQLPGRIALGGHPEERTLCYRLRATGEERWSIVRAEPVFAEDGSVRLAINTIHDVTDRMRATEHVRLLGDTSALLAASLNFEETLARVADLLVPAIADYALIDLVDDDGGLRPVLIRHLHPEHEEILREIRRRYPPEGNPGHPATQVLATGQPLLIHRADADVLREAALDEEHLALYNRLQPSSYVVVPCVARGRTIGTLSLGTGA
jgi:PAS domain S-box-containing protein